MFSSFTNEDFDFKASILQNALYRPVVVTAVFIAIALVIGLVILGFAIFSNKVKVITALSGVGFLSTIAAYISFGFFANPLLSGEVTISELFNVEGIIATTIISFLGDVVVCALDTAFFGVMFIMLGILAWSISVIIVNKGEEKEKAMKAAAKLSERYINDRFLPDKAIDVMDEAAAKVRLGAIKGKAVDCSLEVQLNGLQQLREEKECRLLVKTNV